MKYRTPILLFLAMTCVAGTADARMYQWRHPESGTIQLSGTPPAWYRDGGSRPRVFVFDNGQLIDDTAIPVGEAQRALLREQALGASEVSIQPAAVDEIQSGDQLREALENAARDGVDVNALAADAADQAREDDAAVPGTIADTVAELKAMLNAWDEIRAGEARSVLDGLQSEAP